jgi:hypothetical protein
MENENKSNEKQEASDTFANAPFCLLLSAFLVLHSPFKEPDVQPVQGKKEVVNGFFAPNSPKTIQEKKKISRMFVSIARMFIFHHSYVLLFLSLFVFITPMFVFIIRLFFCHHALFLLFLSLFVFITPMFVFIAPMFFSIIREIFFFSCMVFPVFALFSGKMRGGTGYFDARFPVFNGWFSTVARV